MFHSLHSIYQTFGKALLLACLLFVAGATGFAQSGNYHGVYNGYFLNGNALALTGIGPTELVVSVDDLFHPATPATVSTAISQSPLNGTATLSGDGHSITYIPNSGFLGIDSLTFDVCDATTGLCHDAICYFQVFDDANLALDWLENGTPTILPNSWNRLIVMVEGSSSGSGFTTDIESLTATNGVGEETASGNVIYLPNSSPPLLPDMLNIAFCTSSPIILVPICDTLPVNIGTSNIIGGGIIANNDYVYTPMPDPIIVNVLDNDSYSGAATIDINIILPPENGTASLTAAGSVAYTPDPAFMGLDTLVYELCDDVGNCDQATVYIDVTDEPAPMVEAIDDTIQAIGASFNFNPLANDSGDGIEITNLCSPNFGAATIEADGTVTYAYNTGAIIDDLVCYTICSVTTGECDNAAIYITTTSGGSIIVPINDHAITYASTNVDIGILNNDFSWEPMTTINIIEPPENGTATLDPAMFGIITYSPISGFVGMDTLVYEVCDDFGHCGQATVYITVSSTTPIIIAENDAASTNMDTPVIIDVLMNDTYSGALNLSVSIGTVAANGIAQVTATGSIIYTPDPGFIGTDVFTYLLCDDMGVCDEGIVFITVAEPVTTSGYYGVYNAYFVDGMLVSFADLSFPNELTLLTSELFYPDVPTTVSTGITTPPAYGTATTSSDGLSIVYVPNTSVAADVDSLVFNVCDAATGVCHDAICYIQFSDNSVIADWLDNGVPTVLPDFWSVLLPFCGGYNPTLPPVNNMTIDSLTASHGIGMEMASGNVIYTPNSPGITTPDVLNVHFCVTGPTIFPACPNILYINIGISNATNTIFANNDYFDTSSPNPATIDVLANDDYDAAATVQINIVIPPENGTVLLTAAGFIVYEPEPGFVMGTDSLVYELCDDMGNCDQATVYISLTDVPPPGIEAVDDYVEATGASFSFNAMGNDNGNAIELTGLCSVPAFGTITFDPDGTMTYAYNTGAIVNDEFCYTICNTTTGECATATVYILAPCTNDCVWPGDANNDGVADNFDVLMLGLGYGYVGGARDPATTAWIGQYAPQWNDSINLLDLSSPVLVGGYVNAKFADCNGNGIINDDDMEAIDLNYGLTHAKTEQQAASTAPAIWFNMPDTVQAGTWVTVDVMAGTSDTPFDAVYGLAFTLNYDPTMVEPGSMSIAPQNDWLTSAGGNLSFSKDLSNGELDAAIVRTNHANTSGYGVVAKATFLVIDNLDGKSESIALTLDASNAVFIKINGEYDALNTQSSSALVTHTGGGINSPDVVGVKLYPNPAYDAVQVQFDGAISGLQLLDLQGQVVYAAKLNANEKTHTIGLSELASGMYILQLQSNVGTLVRKLHHIAK